MIIHISATGEQGSGKTQYLNHIKKELEALGLSFEKTGEHSYSFSKPENTTSGELK